MGDYGFSISVQDLTSSQMKVIEQSIKNLGGTVKTQTQQMQSDFSALGEAANSLKNMLIEAFAVREIFNFGKELMHTAAEFEGFTNVIKYSSTGIVDASRNLDYVRESIDRLHLPMRETYEAFSEMQAGFYGTGIEGEKLRKVFEGVAEASSVLHLQPAQFSRVTFALKEIGELGTLQARQLRMLSFALPGAGNLAAQSLGMTSEKLHEAMKKGEIKSSDFLPKFAATLTEHFSGGLGNAGNSLISQMNDEKNSIIKLFVDMGESLKPFFIDVLHTVSGTMKEIKSIWDSLTGNSSFVESLKFIFDWAVRLVPIWITYKAALMGAALITRVFAINNGVLTASFGELTVMTDGATFAFEGLGSAIAATGIGALVVGIGLAVEGLISMNNELSEAIDKKYKLTESNNQTKSINDQISSIKERAAIIKNLSPEAKKTLAYDVQEVIKNVTDKFPILSKRSDSLTADAKKENKMGFWESARMAASSPAGLATALAANKSAADMKESSKEMAAGIKGISTGLTWVKSFSKQLSDLGIKAPKGGASTGEGIKDDATHTSNLSGASGGLGQAKIIHIAFNGPFQQNNGVKESKNEADEAIQKMIEALNGFSESVNSQ